MAFGGDFAHELNEHFTFLIAIISRKRSVVNADRPEGKTHKIKEPHPQQTSLILYNQKFDLPLIAI